MYEERLCTVMDVDDREQRVKIKNLQQTLLFVLLEEMSIRPIRIMRNFRNPAVFQEVAIK